MDRCQDCWVYQEHAKFCPAQLQTPEQRIAVVASMDWPSERTPEICREAGIPDHEITEGLRRSFHEQHLREIGRGIYGDEAYGAWPEDAMDALRRLRPYKETP